MRWEGGASEHYNIVTRNVIKNIHLHINTHAHTLTHLGLLELGAWLDTSFRALASSLADCS